MAIQSSVSAIRPAVARPEVERVRPSPLALRRLALGLKQTDLCLLTGMAQSTIARIENGRRRPRASTRKRLALALGCSVDDIFPAKSSPTQDDSITHEAGAR